MSSMSCEYVQLFYQVHKSSSGVSSKRYIKKFKRRWIVLKIEFSPVDCRLEHYDKESSWQDQKEGQVENLGEMADVRVLADSEKDHVLEIAFKNRSLFISFDSKTKLDKWRQNLNPLLDRYAVQLMKCPEQPSRIGLYIFDLLSNKIDIYNAKSLSLEWSWEISHLRRFNFHANVPDVEVEAGTRSSTGEGHFFFTGIHMRRLFNGLKERIVRSSSSRPIPIPQPPYSPPIFPPPLPPPRNNNTRNRSKSEYKAPSPEKMSLSIVPPKCRIDPIPSLDAVNSSCPLTTTAIELQRSTPLSFSQPTVSTVLPATPHELDDDSLTGATNSLSSSLTTPPHDLDHTPSTTATSSLTTLTTLFELDHTPANTHVHLDEPVESSDSDMDDSTYVEMKATMAMGGRNNASDSQWQDDDYDAVENWHLQECPIQNNPAYLPFESIVNF